MAELLKDNMEVERRRALSEAEEGRARVNRERSRIYSAGCSFSASMLPWLGVGSPTRSRTYGHTRPPSSPNIASEVAEGGTSMTRDSDNRSRLSRRQSSGS